MIIQYNGVTKQLLIASCVYLGIIMTGYTIGWTTSVIPKLQDPGSSPLSGPITDLETSLVGSIQFIGGLVGPSMAGYLSNVKGRKSCMFLGAITNIIGYVFLARAATLVMIYIGRILCGFGIGINIVTILVYLGEIASTEIRGILLTGVSMFVAFGTLLAFSVGPFVPYSMTAYVGICVAFVYAVAILWIPESPTYYAIKGKEDAAKNVLIDLGRTDEIDKVLSSNKQTESLRDWKELFIHKGNRRALIINLVLIVSQQWSGTIAVTFYATSIFQLAASNVDPAFSTIILGFTQFIGSLLTPIFVERSGRRSLLVTSSAVCSLSMLVLGIYFYLTYIEHWALYMLNWMPLASLMAFCLGFYAGLGTIPNALAGEMFEPNVRSKGCAAVITTSGLTSFTVITAFGSLISIIGVHVVFWIFSASCAFTVVYTVFFVPETKGKSLKEIRDMLNK